MEELSITDCYDGLDLDDLQRLLLMLPGLTKLEVYGCRDLDPFSVLWLVASLPTLRGLTSLFVGR